MNFHYNVINKEFDNYNLIYSDTDSFVYNIEHTDIYINGSMRIKHILIYLRVLMKSVKIIKIRKY